MDAHTGKETLVRGLELVGTPLVTVNRILALGRDDRADNSYCGARSGWIMVSHIAPSALVAQVEMQRIPEERERPPLLSSPLHE